MKDDLLKAIELALKNEWDAAHGIAQQYEGDERADWLHAVLHKIEGDMGNSRYWYVRAHALEHFQDEPQQELELIRMSVQGAT